MAGFSNDTVFGQVGLQIGDFTKNGVIEKGRFQFEESGASVTVLINNTSDTGSSDANQNIRVEGTSGGDPYQRFQVGSSDSFSIGIDNASGNNDILVFNYNDDGDCSPSNNTNQMMRFASIDPVTGRSTVVIRSGLAVAGGGVMSGARVLLEIQNPDEAVDSDATLLLSTGNPATGAGGGSQSVLWGSPGQVQFSLGQGKDQTSSTQPLEFQSAAFASGDPTLMTIHPGGEINFSQTPCFFAVLASTVSNVTGDGTNFLIVFDGELFDQGSNFDISTGLFTAPVTGRYAFQWGVQCVGLLSAHTQCVSSVTTSNRLVRTAFNDPFANSSASGRNLYTGACITDMDAGDTAQIDFQISNGTLVVDIEGNASNGVTWFSGKLTA